MALAWQNKTGSLPYVWKNDNGEVRGIALKGSYLFLQQLDLALTLFGVHRGLAELNPFMKGVLSAPLQLAIIKIFIPFLIAWFLPSKFLVPGIVILSVVVAWNIKELLLLL
jgi:hypothetical protein